MSVLRSAGFILFLALSLVCGCHTHQQASGGGSESVTGVQPVSASCQFLSASEDASSNKLAIRADLLLPDHVVKDGWLVFERGEENAKITCVGKDCDTRGADTLICSHVVASPGLINAHDHIDYNENYPLTPKDERYQHRHDWRKGVSRPDGNYTKLKAKGHNSVAYAEVRMLLSGVTSVAGYAHTPNLVRNLDNAENAQLPYSGLFYDIFPLNDRGSEGKKWREAYYRDGSLPDCSVYMLKEEGMKSRIHHLHIGEGIDTYTRHEFECYLEMTDGYSQQIAVVHGISLLADD
ncbi:MAG: hypothetical protein CSA75_04460, partial [Sorangium cellulosum]